MHISIFHSIKQPLVGHRFGYSMISEETTADGLVAKVAFFNATTLTGGLCNVQIQAGEMASSDDVLRAYAEMAFLPIEDEDIQERIHDALKDDSEKRAAAFTRLKLKELCSEIVDWRDKGLMAPKAAILELKKICAEYIGPAEALGEAERLVSLEAMRFAITVETSSED